MSDRPPTRSDKVRRLSRSAFITEKHGLRRGSAKQYRSATSGRYASRGASSKPKPSK